MQSLAIHRHEEVIQRLSQGEMCKDAVANNGIGQLSHHGDLQHRHHFAGFHAKDPTSNLVCLCIDDSRKTYVERNELGVSLHHESFFICRDLELHDDSGALNTAGVAIKTDSLRFNS